MKKFLLYLLASLSISSAAQAANEPVWHQIKACKATQAFYATKGGTFLMSDYQFDYSGGIYVSKDQGETWTKAEIADYNYNKFYEAGEYVFAVGGSGRIARSKDDGSSWEILNYQSALEGLVDPANRDYTQCYAIAYHNDRLYIGDFSGGGVLYSEDFGESWKNTDIETLSYDIEEDPKTGKTRAVECIYNLASSNGRLYCFGIYFVFRLNEDGNTWKIVRSDSNFMSQSVEFQGKLCCGRSCPNDSFDTPFIVCTEDGDTWGEIKRPEGISDNNIRCMATDGENLFVGLQQGGLYYTPDGGENWAKITEGIPEFYRDQYTVQYLSPLTLQATDEYVYVAIYDTPTAQNDGSGVYRLAKADLPEVSGITDITIDSAVSDGNALQFSHQFSSLEIFDLSGRKYDVGTTATSADISSLSQGIYIYRAGTADGVHASGKFVKK